MKKQAIFTALICLLGVRALMAQPEAGKVRFTLNYSVGIPTSSLKENVTKTSFRGFGGSLMVGVNEHIAVGLEASHQDFYQKYPRQVYALKDGSVVSAVLTNSVQTLPVLLKGQYSFLPGNRLQPFVTMGIGGSLNSFSQYLGEFGNQVNGFYLAASPEAGIFIPLGVAGQSGIRVGASYLYLPFHESGIEQLSHFSVHAGISVPLR
jgi:opacity protein-like surface antigen